MLELAALSLLWAFFCDNLTVAGGDYRIWILQAGAGSLLTLGLVAAAWRSLRGPERFAGALFAILALAVLADAALVRAPQAWDVSGAWIR